MDIEEPRSRGLGLGDRGLALRQGSRKGERTGNAAVVAGFRTGLGDGRPATECLAGLGRWGPTGGFEGGSGLRGGWGQFRGG